MSKNPSKDYTLLQEIGLNKSQIACYSALREIGHVRAADLANKLGKAAPDVYRNLKRLEKIGFVTSLNTDDGPRYFSARLPEDAIEHYFQYQLDTIRPLIDLRLTRRARF